MKVSVLAGMVLAAVMGAAVMAQEQAPARPRIQPLLGFGSNPSPGGGSGSSATSDAFFDDSVLQEIRFTINSKDWQTLKDNYLSNEYYPCDFRWRDQTIRNVGIRSRGTGSRSGIKPGLRVDFDRYTSGQRFGGLKSFVLRNNTQDQTNLHERLSMLLFRRVGEPAPRETHAKMFVNDEYVGLFTIVESVDRDFLKKNLGEDTGYLYKYDYPVDGTPYYFEDRGADGAAYVPLPFKPETNETNPRPEFIAQWVQAVNQSSAAAFQAAVGEFIDFPKFIRHVAVEVFVGDYDGFIGNYGINNFYVYRFDNQKRFQMIPWDKSEAFKAGPESSIFHNLTDVPDAQRNRLFTRILSYPELYSLYLDTLTQIANSAADGSWLEQEIQKEYQQIRDAARADTTKPYSNDDFESSIQGLLNFARTRSAQVTAQVAAARR
ncbi:MAG TPA: CotH kinase family protein [Vicinamibacterales bacterium]|nr:CotH kinase family protein [Vicinamibacterales bacterium]